MENGNRGHGWCGVQFLFWLWWWWWWSCVHFVLLLLHRLHFYVKKIVCQYAISSNRVISVTAIGVRYHFGAYFTSHIGFVSMFFIFWTNFNKNQHDEVIRPHRFKQVHMTAIPIWVATYNFSMYMECVKSTTFYVHIKLWRNGFQYDSNPSY